MKQFIKKFMDHFFGSPVLPALVVICSVFVIFFTSDNMNLPKEKVQPPVYVMKAVKLNGNESETISTSTSTTSSVSTSLSVTASSTTTAASVTADETEIPKKTEAAENDEHTAPSYNYQYISAGESPNSSFYQDRLTIIGDSIAYGFNAYGYIPYEHNVAAESLAVWNMNDYSFDLGGGSMGVFDAASYVYSPLYFISIGMNDLYSYTPDDYAWNMRYIAEEILARVPTATIIVGAITPVSDGNYYTSNETIRDFNWSLEYVINDMDTSQVMFFNTYDVLCDQNTLALGYDFAGGDGLHLNGSSYGYILSCMFNFLDTTPAIEQIEAHESSY